MMNDVKSDSKDFVKLDAAILALILGLFAITQTQIDNNYSSGYTSIWGFFLGETLIQVFF